MNIHDIYSRLPNLETPRLILRKMSLADAEDVYEYASDPQVTRFTLWEPHRSLQDSIDFLHNVAGLYAGHHVAPWGIEIRTERKLVGTCGFVSWQVRDGRAEIGYGLSRNYWGQGLMTEAVKAVIDFGFTSMELNRIQAMCDIENHPSYRVMEKAGLQFEGILRGYVLSRGEFRDQRLYSILREEWNHGLA